MDVIKISDIKLLLVLSRDEVKKYRFQLKINGQKETIKRILKDIGEDVGLTEEDALSVNMFQSIDGGCEMFVTKLDDNLYYKCRDGEIEAMKYIYRFVETEPLLEFCKLTDSLKKDNGNITVFKDNERSGYYIVSEKELHGASEFGAKRISTTAALYLSEHCKKLDGADIGTLARLAGS